MKKKNKTFDEVNAYLKQWREIKKGIAEQFAPLIRQQEAIKKSIQPMIEAQKALQKSLGPIQAEQERWRKLAQSIHLPRVDIPDISYLTKPILEYQKAVQEHFAPAFRALRKSLQELPSHIKKALLQLGSHGWFFDIEMPMPWLWELEKALAEGDTDQAEEALIEYFRARLNEIERSIVSKFPHRRKIITSAFDAHRRGEYELSIPVLLAQTDGICKEIADQYFFLKKAKKPRTSIYVEQIASDTLRAAILSPLANPLPISASEYERPKDFNELNRHMVLHGESVDYGTEVNSLKAISLLNYVSQVLALDNDTP